MTSPEARAKLVEALTLDVVGPWPGHAFAHELLPENPNRWYLTGYLVPEEAPLEHKSDAESQDEPDAGGEGGGMDDSATPDKAAVTPSLLPSSIGLSVLIAPNTKKLEIEVSWGDYDWEDPGKEDPEPSDDGLGVKAEEDGAYPQSTGDDPLAGEPPAIPVGAKPLKGFRRSPHLENVPIILPPADGRLVTYSVTNSGGLIVATTLRPVASDPRNRIPAGTHALCVFLINKRPKAERAYQGNAFQARLRLTFAEALIPRPDLRGCTDENASQDWDADIADLQYRRVFDYVSGIGCSAEPLNVAEGGPCYSVQTCWVPSAEVEFVGHLAGTALTGVELEMEALAKIASVEEARAKLGKLVDHYRTWIAAQASAVAAESGMEQTRRETSDELIHRAGKAADRIAAGIESLSLADVREAFCTANRVMARQARQREGQRQGKAPDLVPAPAWRAFQLGFILLNLRGLHDPTHPERELVDLLFFPTGGGKTEAYLGLAAFSLVLRRLRNPGPRGGGVNILMRYTLRLLTLDQLGRAAALICAMELDRHERKAAGDKRLGDWPFEIGLWVGSTATPNRMGGPNDQGPGKDTTAYSRTNKFKRDSNRNPSPIPLENCPWCGEKFDSRSFNLIPFKGPPKDLRITCVNAKCAFTGDRHLPIVAVDEAIYRRLPCFLIATVDKFASLPWMGASGKLFGQVDRYHKAATDIGTDGFYSVAEHGIGQPLGGPLLPPELIIQDELHLISGPLGTIAGIFETAIGHLAERDLGDGKKLRPKIIASTATVRQAEAQIRSLFGREHSRVFPPPGPDRRDTFFSKTHPSTQTPARLYLGVAAQGRSLKVVLLRTALSLLSGGQQLYKQAGVKSSTNPVDPYMTLLGYFNSLRELGGSRRIVEDEVTSQLQRYDNRKRRDPVDTLFTKRKIGEPRELTSRVSTDNVADVKRRLAQSHNEDDHVDIALATNMISVGLDITRLGLMVVLGQPKMSAEYIQATSRVGRLSTKPGLVVTLLNVHKPRDRSHYEHFGYYHATFYRTVEATSVTPFSPRALDRALAPALVAFARHHLSALVAPTGASGVIAQRHLLDPVADAFADRAAHHRDGLTATEQAELRAKVRDRCLDLLGSWCNVANAEKLKSATLQYGNEVPGQPALLRDFLDEKLASLSDDHRKFRANRSMRDVEPSVDLFPKDLRG
jgi:hypothetical protein